MTFKSLILVACLAGCAATPELNGRVRQSDPGAAYPDLVPLAPLLARADGLAASPQTSPAAITTMNNRVAGLKSRAARLRGPVVDGATRARMQAARARAALQ